MAEFKDWDKSAASNSSAAPNGWPEHMDFADVNDSGREGMAVLSRWRDDNNGTLVSGGTSSAYTLTPNQTISAYYNGLTFTFQASLSSSPQATLNVSGLGDEKIVNPDGSDLDTNQITLGGKYSVIHDGSNFQLVSGNYAQAKSGRRNILINGGFGVWQEYTSTTLSGAQNGYLGDLFRVGSKAGATVELSRQNFSIGQTDVPGEPEFYGRINCTVGGTSDGPNLNHRIEDVRSFAGQKLAFSFYARVASGTLDVTPRASQIFGTGGSSSVTVSYSDITITSTFSRHTVIMSIPSISGKSIGSSNDDFLSLELKFPTATAFDFSIANAQAEIGSVVTDFDYTPLEDTLRKCKRYYQKSFSESVDVGQDAGTDNALTIASPTDGNFLISIDHEPEMRITPIVTTYNPSAANGSARNITDSTDTAVTLYASNDKRSFLFPTSSDTADANDLIQIHYTLDARL